MTKKKNPFYMAGTEGTGKYVVIAKTGRGRVGVRPLDGCTLDTMVGADHARIRVEPVTQKSAARIAGVLTVAKGWKRPGDDGQRRFSRVVYDGGEKLKLQITKALTAIGVGNGLKVTMNPKAPKWARKLVSEMSAS
jgi:hypothetical protein